ncbi:tRNA dihydrouridine synthase DusB [Candidatus Epulonipiscium viviparus]|uniref:tRNA dihydrouridine synthase DusB n=1 Tax=Candidatus Epulonipiscium viviparus TaxID=420336 RepID=UPI00273805EF|nr:tRNA dihydrouridine synthase DusB [Candidatus Epulopiscium viviparus]
MKIGTIEIPNNIALAPMAGFTDLPYRNICKEFGAGLVYTEMVSAKALLYENDKTCVLLQVADTEHPVAAQLFGSDPSILSAMAQQVSESSVDFIDLNMGCPAPKITKNGEGSALLANPKLVYTIVSAVAKASPKPVTVKIRKGYTEVNAIEVAQAIEAAGASAITLHGRTRDQFYSGVADWDIIKKVKSKIAIPLIGNGDIKSPEDAKAMLDYTNCDAIMIGRAALGNPWIFQRTLHYLNTGELLPDPTLPEKIEIILKHTQSLIAFKGEYIGIREMRAHLSCYIKGFPQAAKLRSELNKATSLDDIKYELNKLL